AHPSPVHLPSTCHPSPCNGFSPSPTTTMAPCPWGSRPVGHPGFRWCCTYERDVGAPFIPFNALTAHRPSCEEYVPRNLDGQSRTCALRIIFRDLSQAICVV